MRVTAAVIRRGEVYLLCRRRSDGEMPGKWEFPGGKIEPGESPWECLVREIREELDLEAYTGSRIGVSKRCDGEKQLELIAFCAEVEAGTPALNNHQEHAWVAAESLLDYDLAPADFEIARWIAEGKCKQ